MSAGRWGSVLVSSVLLFAAFAITGCAGHVPASPLPLAPAAKTGKPASEIPPAYRCLPTVPAAHAMRPSIAYGCAVADAKEAARLQELAVGLMGRAPGVLSSYCTGVPLAYNSTTKIGFVLTAAHCVVGGSKHAGASISPQNITVFPEREWVYQAPTALSYDLREMTGHMEAVYVPTQYCRAHAFASGQCSHPHDQDGDVAVLKIKSLNGLALQVNRDLRLAPADLNVPDHAEIMALGYGQNATSAPRSRVLHYITDTYYGSRPALLTILTSYHHDGSYYNVICKGDSGGPDLYWDGRYWNVLGVHSYGPVVPCGNRSTALAGAYSASADERPWNQWVRLIVVNDYTTIGCGPLDPTRYVCRARP